MKKALFFVLSLLAAATAYAQNDYGYYLEIDPSSDPPPKVTAVTKNGTLHFKSTPGDFSAFLNRMPIYGFEPAYPQAKSKRLRRIYKVWLKDTTMVAAFLKRKAVAAMTRFGRPDLSASYPDDYFLKASGKPNPALQLIRAPQAWQITHGDSTHTYVGIVDRGIALEQEDLKGKVTRVIRMGNTSHSDHGTYVASMVAESTDNGKGLASIGYNTKIAVVTGTYSLLDGLDSISKIPGIKVINCSWSFCNYSKRRMAYMDSIMTKVRQRGILVICSAGNGNEQPCRLNENDRINGFHYPASIDYDNVISVTSVGCKFPIGHFSEKYQKSGWADCHENNVDTNDPRLVNKHTHNAAVDICAPGYHVPFAKKGNTYEMDGWGTSLAAPIVTGVAALMFAVNKNLTAQQAREILLNTADDIYYIPYNKKYKGQLGSGRVNAYRAVLTAKCMADPTPGLDLMVRDAKDDFGKEPYVGNNYSFQSPDIWVRHRDDGKLFKLPQQPEYQPYGLNYVYVRITNTSCQTSTGKEKLSLYWEKAGATIPPPKYGKHFYKDQKRVGGLVAIKHIPVLQPGEETVVAFPWHVPNPSDYDEGYKHPNAFYLLGRISTDADPMTAPLGRSVVDNVVNNNNVAWLKVSVKP